MTLEEYLNLITSEHRDKPNFIATVTADIDVPIRVQSLLSSMITIFDPDTAVGDQLDIIGKWVGVSREVAIPISGVYFTWDGGEFVGWDYGVWQDHLQPASISVLPDDSYRTLIKARIAANKWDGTTEGAYRVWEEVFTTFTILIDDHQDMSYDLAIVGGVPDSLTIALFTGGYIPLKPEGVHVNTYFIPVDDGPLFGWDVDSEFITGWDTGSWARELTPT